ncbi:sperm-associated antigen 17 isoform X2 [Melanotaenia boesemani]|uniref:sperm-associated antigen 17 isoform X2 n=1 Tax=Melanotaenia boesemani TaxID=1250792 RepID=UPI001C05971C|nr:sperm-associated antigen 17 isoform X2 [Melanotaenia boesemani]
MPPRKKGSGINSNNAPAQPVNKNWEAGLVRAQFEEDSWRVCVSLVAGGSREEEEVIQALSLAVQKPQRKRFTLITWDNTIEKIHELGNPKTKKPDDAPMFYEVTEPAKVLLDAGKEIPCDLLAKILKFQLLQIKAKDQRRRELEQTEKEKIAPSSDRKDKGEAKISDKKGKGPSAPVPSTEKKTKLKRRDDIDPPTFIDDEPECGPQHYVLLVGFYQPNLIAFLDAISVHVANTIRLCSEHTHTFREQQEQPSCEANEQSSTVSPVLDAEVDVQARRLDLFWSGLRQVLESGPPDSKLHDIVQLSYIVPDISRTHPQDPEAVMELGSHIFDGVASLIYDSLEWRRQHQHYRDSIKLINVLTVVELGSQSAEVVPSTAVLPQTQCSKKTSVPAQGQADKETMPPPFSVKTDMRYYSNLLDLVPPEACSVPVILHCVLEQVVMSTEDSFPTLSHTADEHKAVKGPWLDQQLLSYMLQSFLPDTVEERSCMLNNLLSTVETEEDKRRLMEKFGAVETQKKSEKPLVIRHHDERTLRLRDITVAHGFNPAEVELSMMRLSPVWELIQSVAKQRNSASCWMSVKQQLQHFCTDDTLSWPDVQRLFHQSVFESMTLTTLDQQGVLLDAGNPLATLESAQQKTTVIPWDNPLCYAKQQLHNLQIKGPTSFTEDPGNVQHLSGKVCSQLDLSEMQSSRLRSLFEFHYTEHHDAGVFPQVLQLASEEYRCLDTFRGSHNNVLYIFCHNPMSSDRQSKELWDVKLHTDVKFRKYLEHVADTISDWTREEKLKRDTIQIRNQRPADPPKDEKAVCLAEEEDKLEPVIRKDSLKAWKLEQERQKEEETAKTSKKEKMTKSKQQMEPQPTDTKKSKALSGDKKSRPNTAGRSAIARPESSLTEGPRPNENQDLQPTEDPFSGFIGYNLDGQLIHVSGCVQNLFPSDGGKITVENVRFVEGSSLMKLAVKKDGHHFYTHINQVVINPARCDLKKGCDGKEAGQLKVPKPLEVKTVKQGSFSAVLDNKIHLSYSFFGPTGENAVTSQEAKGGNSHISTPEAIHVSSVPHSKGIDMESVPSRTHAQSIQGCEDKPAEPSSSFKSFNASVPNGLLLQFQQEDIQGASPEEKGILVRQSFPLHGRGQMQDLQDIYLSKELSRIITSHGAVIRYMRDGSTEVLFADGSVSFSKDSGPVWVCDSDVQAEHSQEVKDEKKDVISAKEAGTEKGCWWTTSPSGNRICTIGTTHKHIPTSPLLTFKSTDPITHQVMLSREDLVVSVQNPDGSQIVEHRDGTRITSLLQDRPLFATPHLFHTRQKPESVTLKSTSQCASGCMCVTHSVDSLNENVHIQDGCDSENEISRNSAGNTCDKEGACSNSSQCGCTQSNVDKNDEQSVFPDENVAENGKTSPCESEKGSKSTKERVLLVEKEGCAMVVMYPERHTAHIFLADGTIITGNNQGKYEVFPSSKGFLQIQSDGKYVYSSDPLVTPSPKHCNLTNQPGIYTMSHTDKVACDVTDDNGNHFQVMDDGQVSVLRFSPAPSTLKDDEEELEEDEEKDRQFRLHAKHKEHCPRLFLVHEDGSGTELLSSQTVEELLQQAYSDPTIALLMEPLPDKQDDLGITILKPSHQSVWSQWLLGKQNADITPPNLRNRSWHDFPTVEKKSPGPLFGTNIGVGLTLRERSGGSVVQHQPVRSCPKVLEMRELHQHRSCTTKLKNIIDSRLKEYIESLMAREQQSEEMKVKDPRTEEGCSHAKNLSSLFLSFAEEDDANHTADSRITVNVGSLYTRGVRASVEQSDGSEDANTETSSSLERLQCDTNGKDLKWTERLAKHRQEISEEKTYREALQKKNIAPYFHPENIQLYQNLLHHHVADTGSLSMDQPLVPRSDSADALVEDAAQERTPRPLNPTPSQSESHADRSDRVPEKRPTNPTPQTAGESSLRGSSRQCKSVQVDVTGKPRQNKVRLPTCILSSKTCSVPNEHFLTVEEPVRRKCRTVSLADPSTIVRGFQLLPSSVDFGVLQEGTSSTITVVMRNVGVDTCRFRVKQPPPATGLRVIYNPGPVAAGLHVELQVQLFAMRTAQEQVEPKSYISQDIIIYTETDILYLPVAAIVFPEREYNMEDTSANIKRESRAFQLSGNHTHVSQHRPDLPSD